MSTTPAAMPAEYTGAATVWDVPHRLRLLQWVDDAEDIADGDDCDITVNGQTLHAAPQRAVGPDSKSVVLWEIGPFEPGILLDSLVITTLDHGAIQVWWD